MIPDILHLSTSRVPSSQNMFLIAAVLLSSLTTTSHQMVSLDQWISTKIHGAIDNISTDEHTKSTSVPAIIKKCEMSICVDVCVKCVPVLSPG